MTITPLQYTTQDNGNPTAITLDMASGILGLTWNQVFLYGGALVLGIMVFGKQIEKRVKI